MRSTHHLGDESLADAHARVPPAECRRMLIFDLRCGPDVVQTRMCVTCRP